MLASITTSTPDLVTRDSFSWYSLIPHRGSKVMKARSIKWSSYTCRCSQSAHEVDSAMHATINQIQRPTYLSASFSPLLSSSSHTCSNVPSFPHCFLTSSSRFAFLASTRGPKPKKKHQNHNTITLNRQKGSSRIEDAMCRELKPDVGVEPTTLR